MVDEQVDEVAEEGEVIDELEPPQQEKSGFGLGSTADGSDDPIIDEPVDEWLQGISFDSTADVPIPDTLVDQVIGQEDAALVIRKAAEQRRHMMMMRMNLAFEPYPPAVVTVLSKIAEGNSRNNESVQVEH